MGDNVYSGVSPQIGNVQNANGNKFDKAINFTMHPDVEGGYTVDNGGATNFGITQKTADAYNASHGYSHQDVTDITQDDAKHIAKDVYFDSAKLNDLPDRVAVATFDYGYNSGPSQAIKDLQRTVGVRDDGLMGPKTTGAVEDYITKNGEDNLLNNYIDRRQDLMKSLIQNNPGKYAKNAVGWAHRIAHLKGYLGLQDSEGDNGGN